MKIEALAQRTGCQYLVLILNGTITDTWQARVFPSLSMKDAVLQLFKLTPEDLALQIQSYLTSGIMGELKIDL